ncbi:MAG: hypothetical protein HS108_15070 [Planctomycetes bacterium]|jgi:hypothetical protein|nr:hypothetical protein [Planctomycetota bacterium]MCL4729143.1 hypothetical protein [Planctomycetota bacterium]
MAIRAMLVLVMVAMSGAVALATAGGFDPAASALLSGSRDDVPKRGPAGKATIVADPENIVASELFGTWVLDEDVTRRLRGAEGSQVKVRKFTFRANEESATLVCTKLEAMLAKVKEGKGAAVYEHFEEALRSIHLAGEMELERSGAASKHAFAYMTWRGNPHVFWHRVSGDRDDFESFNVMLARDAEGGKDLLFVGSDSATGAFAAYKRESTGN